MLGTVGSIMVSAVSPEFIPEAERQIKTLLRERHRLKSNQDDDFMIRNLADVAATAQSTNQSMSILLASVASVSLLVGGIGIMNIMLVSVTERTREIGIRMAVGAKRQDILTQFLLEAVVLSTLGGIFGVVLGVVGSQLVSAIAEWPTIVPIEAILLAVIFSGAVGIFFGFILLVKLRTSIRFKHCAMSSAVHTCPTRCKSAHTSMGLAHQNRV